MLSSLINTHADNDTSRFFHENSQQKPINEDNNPAAEKISSNDAKTTLYLLANQQNSHNNNQEQNRPKNINDLMNAIVIRKVKMDEKLAKKLIDDSPEELKLILKDFQLAAKTDNPALKKRLLTTTKILFVGEPGIGKSETTLALAQLLNRPVFFIKSSIIEDEYKNSGAQNINRIINKIKEIDSPCIIVFDEIHSILSKKKSDSRSDQDPAVALWQILDECENNPNTLFIGTSNTLQDTHPAIKNRFDDCIIQFEMPDIKKREQILSFYLENNLDTKLLKEIASKTNNFSSRNLKALSVRMLRNAARRNSETVNKTDFESAFKIITENKKLQIDEEETECEGMGILDTIRVVHAVLTAFISLGR